LLKTNKKKGFPVGINERPAQNKLKEGLAQTRLMKDLLKEVLKTTYFVQYQGQRRDTKKGLHFYQ